MRILIASPIPATAIGGPASMARLLSQELKKKGDAVTVATQNTLEKKIPPPFRQILLFLRAVLLCLQHDAVMLLDPASTGISFAYAAKITGRKSVLRVGGDFLWESYVERTKEPLLLSEFYASPREYTRYENLIRSATKKTVQLADAVAFTNAWIQNIWNEPYNLSGKEVHVIPNPLAPADPQPAAPEKRFTASGRPMRIKNIKQLAEEVWPQITERNPEAILDIEPKKHDAYLASLRNAYAVILPSLSDVSPNSILEAIQYGKPFISTKDTGLYEEYKERGIFIDTRNPEELRTAIETLLDPKEYQKWEEKVRSPYNPITPEMIAGEFRKLLVP